MKTRVRGLAKPTSVFVFAVALVLSLPIRCGNDAYVVVKKGNEPQTKIIEKLVPGPEVIVEKTVEKIVMAPPTEPPPKVVEAPKAELPKVVPTQTRRCRYTCEFISESEQDYYGWTLHCPVRDCTCGNPWETCDRRIEGKSFTLDCSCPL